jgi:hypothetical protein
VHGQYAPQPGARTRFLNPCKTFIATSSEKHKCAVCGYGVLTHERLDPIEVARIRGGADACLATHLAREPFACIEGQCRYCGVDDGTARDHHAYHCPHFLVFLLSNTSFFKAEFALAFGPDYIWVEVAKPKPVGVAEDRHDRGIDLDALRDNVGGGW